MSNSTKWKNKFLSSSFPLEFDVAKQLVVSDFKVTPDYTYPRKDYTNGGSTKDFSVDIEANTYFDDAVGRLNLLVECKYRDFDTKWLFLPDVNSSYHSLFSLHSIRVIDKFSPYKVKRGNFINFLDSIPKVYKGTELCLHNQSVYDNELRHGLSQLQYALPRYLADSILFEVIGDVYDNLPIIFCPILVTTAELIVLDSDMSMEKVRNIDDIYQLGKTTPFVQYYYDIGYDFKSHCINEFKRLRSIEAKNYYLNEQLFKESIETATDLELGDKLDLYFTEFLICNYSVLPALIEKLRFLSEEAFANKKIRT